MIVSKDKHVTKFVYHIFGEKPSTGTTVDRLIRSLNGEVHYFQSIQSYSKIKTCPTMMLFLGRETETPKKHLVANLSPIENKSNKADGITKSECNSEQNQIEAWLNLCLQIKADTCFIAICEFINYENQIKATKLPDFIYLSASQGYFSCLSILEKCRTCHQIDYREKNKIYIAIFDDRNPCVSGNKQELVPDSIGLIHFGEPEKFVFDNRVKNVTLIAINLAKKNCNVIEVIKLISANAMLSSKALLLYGSHSDQQMLIDNQLEYDGLLSHPFSPEEFFSVVEKMITNANYATRVADELKLANRASEYLNKAIDSHCLVSRADSRGLITFANQKFCDVSQYSEAELIGHSHALINSGYHKRIFFQSMWSTISSGKKWHGLICNKKKDGTRYWVDSTICPIPIRENVGIDKLDDNEQRYNYLSIRTEITDMVINEERLNRSQVFANIGTWDWDIESGNLYWSERIGHLFGFGKDLPETKYRAFLNCIHPEDRSMVEYKIAACIEGTEDYEVEHRVVWPNNEIKWMLEKGDVIRDESGKALHMLGVVQDITETKKIKNELEKAKDIAEKASLAKSKFLASMSHELRTPMNAIIGFTQLLQMDKERPPSANQLDNVMEILSAGKHLLQLIDEVLNLAEIESGKINLSIRSVELGHIINECITLSYPIISKMKINLSVFIEGELIEPSSLHKLVLNVRADSTRLKQIIINLLSNACKYNQKNGCVKISVTSEFNFSKISIEDTGSGIGVENQDRLFLPFNRLGAEQSEIEGTGIGLVITKQLIELMGGDICFTSTECQGSIFSFVIPLEEKRMLSDSRDVANSEEKKTFSDGETTRCNSKRILYVEDNPANLRLVSQLISRLQNVELLSAHNAELGIEIARESIPDLILMDINLPGMSGIDAMHLLKKESNTKNIPISALSANAMPEEIESALSQGFDSYVTKPIDVTHLLVEIESLLNADKGEKDNIREN